jgi:hypothetical protein
MTEGASALGRLGGLIALPWRRPAASYERLEETPPDVERRLEQDQHPPGFGHR